MKDFLKLKILIFLNGVLRRVNKFLDKVLENIHKN